MENSERRGVERFELDLPAKIRVVEAEDDLEIELRTENISCGGAFFRTPRPLPEGTDVRVDLVLDLAKLESLKTGTRHVHVALKGIVTRTDPSGMSVCFNPEYQIRPLQPEAAG
jgi:hypothetical protein